MTEFFFVLGVAKVLRQNALLTRTYTLQSQVANLFSFLSRMAQEGLLESYSAVRQNFTDREAQSVSYELFDEAVGWTFDLRKCLAELSKLARTTAARTRVVVPRA
jgi:hypothetical protein